MSASPLTSSSALPGPAVADGLLRPAEVAVLLSVRPSWVYDAVRSGRLPCLRIGRHIRFTRAMIDAWLTDQLTD
jgi:excisionase family DNA binding protein